MTDPHQLWVLRGGFPVLWTVPYYVDWITEREAHMYAAVPLLAKHELAIRERLKMIATQDRGLWLIKRMDLEKIADRVPDGSDPQVLFSWERPRLAQDPEHQPEKRVDRDEFLDALYQKGVGTSRNEVEFWWNQFCLHSLDWLINKEKPVDMYFLRLHNCPYRQNWKQIILNRFPKFGWVLSHTTDDDRRHAADKRGLTEELLCLDLLAMDKKHGICYRHVEVEHKPSWWKNVSRVERARLRLLQSSAYAGQFMQSVRRRLGISLRIYTQWLAAIARPSATHVETGYCGEFRILPNLPSCDGRSRHLSPIALPAVVSNNLPSFTQASDADDLYRAAQVLFGQVPRIQRLFWRLRRPWQNISRPGGENI